MAETAIDILKKPGTAGLFESRTHVDHSLETLEHILVMMKIQNGEIADYFTKVADFLEIEGANPFRVRAYRNAARTITGLAHSIAELIAAESDLTQLSGIGKELDEKIREIVRTGRLAKLEELESRLPPGLHQVLKIPGLGPRKVKALYHALKIQDLEDLKKAAREGRVRTIEGFGLKTEERILKDIQRLIHSENRTPWFTAEAIARTLTEFLKQDQLLADITVAGSFRRRKETVGDLDILISCRNASAVMNSFTAYEGVERVISQGDTRASIVLRSGLQVDLRVVPQESYGAALHYFTGSKAHNIAVRRLAQKKGMKINEYGVFKNGKRVFEYAEAKELNDFLKKAFRHFKPGYAKFFKMDDISKLGSLPGLESKDDKNQIQKTLKLSQQHLRLITREAKNRSIKLGEQLRRIGQVPSS